jgi:hypothetical protein
MRFRDLSSLVLTSAALCLPIPAADQPVEQADTQDWLTQVAGLPPIGQGGDVIRYVVYRMRSPSYGNRTATVAQAEWSYGDNDQPRVMLIELREEEGVWRVAERREALMHPIRFNQLVNNVAAAAAVIGERGRRGGRIDCSHSPHQRLELRVPDESLQISREAHCDDDAPALVAGELLQAAVELNLRFDWTPARR